MAFAILVQGTAAPDHIDTVKQALTTLARESLQQPGTLRYDFYQSADDATKIFLFAVWEDEAGWRANVASDEHVRYEKSLPEGAWAIRPAVTKLRAFEA